MWAMLTLNYCIYDCFAEVPFQGHAAAVVDKLSAVACAAELRVDLEELEPVIAGGFECLQTCVE